MLDIKSEVNKLINKHGTNDPFEVARACNIQTVFEPLGKTLGFFNTYRRIRFIHINNSISESLQRFVCSHELGHAVLHPKANTPFLKSYTFFSIDKIEVEANTFAVELLLSDEILKEYQNMDSTLQKAAEIHGIPEEVMHLKKF